MASIVISRSPGYWNLKISDLHAKAKVISSVFLDWFAAILMIPLFTVISISSPV